MKWWLLPMANICSLSFNNRINNQWSMINDQWSMINDQWSMPLPQLKLHSVNVMTGRFSHFFSSSFLIVAKNLLFSNELFYNPFCILTFVAERAFTHYWVFMCMTCLSRLFLLTIKSHYLENCLQLFTNYRRRRYR